MGSFLSAPEHDPETGQQFVNIRIEIPKGTTASTLFRDVGNSAKKKGEGDLKAAGGEKPPETPEDAEAKAKAEREKKEKEERERLSAERKEKQKQEQQQLLRQLLARKRKQMRPQRKNERRARLLKKRKKMKKQQRLRNNV